MALRYYLNGPSRALSVPLANGTDTSITVSSAAGFPTQFPYTLILDPNTATEEVVDVTAAAGNVLTITRGVDSTTAVAHASGAVVFHGISARDVREANAHVNATTAIHGSTGALLDVASTQAVSGTKTFDTLRTTAGGAVVDVGTTQAVTGTKTFTDARTATGGAVGDVGSAQTITGNKTYSGTNSHSGPETFTGAVTLGTEVLTGAWTSYAVERHNGAGGPNLNAGNGTMVGKYKKIGDKTVLFRVQLVFGSTTNIGTTDYIFTLPFLPADNRESGTVILFHAAVHYSRIWHGIGGLEIALIDMPGARVGSTIPFAFGTGDVISITGMYEAA